MGIMDIFRSNPAGNNQGQVANMPGQATQGNEATATNGVIPPNGMNPNPQVGEQNESTGKKDESPLDSFKDLWNNTDTKKDDSEKPILSSIDPKQVIDAAGKVNFANVLNKDDLALVSQGGEEAVKAMARSLNAVAQAVYAQNTVSQAQIVQQAIDQLETKIGKTLPESIRRNMIDTAIAEENPAYSHPAAQPMVKLITEQMATKYPNATPAELAKMAKDYFNNSFEAITGTKPGSNNQQQTNQSKEQVDVDWFAELGVPQ